MPNIFGIGIDIIEINRFSKIFKKNRSFKFRVFSKLEIKFCENKKNKLSSYAKRFAAKEAFSKALGTGITNGLNFNEITVKNDTKGKPSINLIGNSEKIVNKIIKRKKFNIFLSLSDEKKYAVAMIVITT
tara:strand:- start:596 stop:985 length:390 start_codon:yes stop_codon:yes gene_type:complete